MIDIHELALNCCQKYIKKMKIYYNQKKVKTPKTTEFEVGDVVWMNIHCRLKSKGKGGLHWEGPCNILSKTQGGLFNLEYKTGFSLMRFNRVHPQFLKEFKGESS